jgi:hypothetical protein
MAATSVASLKKLYLNFNHYTEMETSALFVVLFLLYFSFGPVKERELFIKT